ncbi:hypothetical protein B0O99DRAFT_668756 [Bisporella sp. PMI_857]|nr:hypothetical protein B0O99DRAFT_668756 [Bisporella sp. PMI_857]
MHNYKTLEGIHKKAERWALQHGSKFAPAKYELVHFSRDPKANTTHAPHLPHATINASLSCRHLGIQMDTRLRCSTAAPHGTFQGAVVEVEEALWCCFHTDTKTRGANHHWSIPNDRWRCGGSRSTLAPSAAATRANGVTTMCIRTPPLYEEMAQPEYSNMPREKITWKNTN